LNLHSTHPALSTDAGVEKVEASDASIFSYKRRSDDRMVFVLLNLSPETKRFRLTGNKVSGRFKNAFSNAPAELDAEAEYEMAGWEFLVYVR
jgi:glycosidase